GMMGALAQINDKLDRMPAARPEKQRRPIGGGARAVGGDQHIRSQEAVLVRQAKLAQSGGAHFLPHFDKDLRVETESAALGDHRRERGDGGAVLSLIVGSPAPVDALALDRHAPRGTTPAPTSAR